MEKVFLWNSFSTQDIFPNCSFHNGFFGQIQVWIESFPEILCLNGIFPKLTSLIEIISLNTILSERQLGQISCGKSFSLKFCFHTRYFSKLFILQWFFFTNVYDKFCNILRSGSASAGFFLSFYFAQGVRGPFSTACCCKGISARAILSRCLAKATWSFWQRSGGTCPSSPAPAADVLWFYTWQKKSWTYSIAGDDRLFLQTILLVSTPD